MIAIFFPVVIALFPAASRADRPNVLLVTVDTMRPDHLGCYGYKRATTPNLDRLAARSVVFDRTYTQGGWTKPAMASLMLSMWTQNHRVTRGNVGLPKEAPTLAEQFHNAGYRTLGIQTNPWLRESRGFGRGFEKYPFEADLTADQVVDRFFANRPSGSPWFAYLHFMDPHLPYSSPRGKFSKAQYQGRFSQPKLAHREVREAVATLTAEEKQFLIDRYDEEIAFFDQHFGTLLERLTKEGAMSNTIIVILADHGEEFFEHKGFEHGHSLYNEILHVPLIIYDPKAEPRRVPEVVRVVDVYPTLLARAGIPLPPQIAGIDLAPFLHGHPRQDSLVSLSAGMRIGPQREAIQDKSFKYIDTVGGTPRFFDLIRDPGEQENLALKDGSKEKRLDYRRMLNEYRKQGPANLTQESAPLENDQDSIKSLKTLGYL